MSWSHPNSVVDDTDFKLILDRIGKTVTIKRRSSTGDRCPCYDPQYARSDPYCTRCSGTGNLAKYVETITRAEVQFQQPPSLAGMDSYYTRVGSLERDYAVVYMEKDNDIRSEDYLLLNFLAYEEGLTEAPEYRVSQVRKVYGTYGNILYLHVQIIKEAIESGRTGNNG